MNHETYDNAYISGILNSVKTVAIVGASANDVRPSYFVTKYLIDKGYEVFPVNPGQAGKEILGRRVYASLAEIPVAIDMVDIFRASSAVPAIMDEVLELDPLPKVVWMQLTVRHDEAAGRAEAAGIKAVPAFIAIDQARNLGGLLIGQQSEKELHMLIEQIAS